jgi:hypothetical protein
MAPEILEAHLLILFFFFSAAADASASNTRVAHSDASPWQGWKRFRGAEVVVAPIGRVSCLDVWVRVPFVARGFCVAVTKRYDLQEDLCRTESASIEERKKGARHSHSHSHRNSHSQSH